MRGWFGSMASRPVGSKLAPGAGRVAAVQPLERRVCLSAVVPLGTPQDTISLSDGNLDVWGTDGPDQVRFERVPSPGTPDKIMLNLNGRTWFFDQANIRGIFVHAFGGNDFIHFQRTVPAPALIRAGGGDDYMVGGAGQDEFFGGLGTDTISFEYRDDPGVRVFVTLDDRADDGDNRRENVHSDVENVIGGAGDDWIVGSLANIRNRFEGRGGNDVLSGVGGDDVLLGGPGDDELIGGDGNDALS